MNMKKKYQSQKLHYIKIIIWLIIIVAVAELSIRTAAVLLERKNTAFQYRKGNKTIYCIGDSFTYGLGVEKNQAWPSIVSTLLNKDHPEEYTVVNLGLPGYSSSSCLYITAQLIKEKDPFLLIVLCGWNANNNDFMIFNTRNAHDISLLQHGDIFFENLKLYRLFKWFFISRKNKITADAIDLVPMSNQMSLYNFTAYQKICLDNVSKIVQLCKNHTTPLLLLNYPYRRIPDNKYGLHYEYYHLLFGKTPLTKSDYIIRDRKKDEMAIHSVIRHVANHEHVQYVDLHECFKDHDPDELFLDDYHHPSVLGHKKIALEVFQAIHSPQ
ncbi:MAG: hypothetical protein GF384_00835 [Elusimicrobia bacterium]|nr:hypothetical protein [Elusimicrobiota bacterium]